VVLVFKPPVHPPLVGILDPAAYGMPADAIDEYVQIGESTAREALHRFCSAVISAFGSH
jgi:hypothetical protein